MFVPPVARSAAGTWLLRRRSALLAVVCRGRGRVAAVAVGGWRFPRPHASNDVMPLHTEISSLKKNAYATHGYGYGTMVDTNHRTNAIVPYM